MNLEKSLILILFVFMWNNENTRCKMWVVFNHNGSTEIKIHKVEESILNNTSVLECRKTHIAKPDIREKYKVL